MKDRKSRIITGCNFIKGLINDGKSHTPVFERAATRLMELLSDEIAGEPEAEDSELITLQEKINENT